ncbi:hypothetical protein [Pseudomonas sp. GLN_2]|uniref:hypothetical protein n=1 Tax=Pseudomonas sp. GLN_2 TaxID=3367180 RepID=UPI00370B6B80
MARAVVGAGSPEKGPSLLAKFHPPFAVAATTVFAGKPAPTLDTRQWLSAGRRVEAGLTAKRPALLANFHPPITVAATTVFAGKPAQGSRLLPG